MVARHSLAALLAVNHPERLGGHVARGPTDRTLAHSTCNKSLVVIFDGCERRVWRKVRLRRAQELQGWNRTAGCHVARADEHAVADSISGDVREQVAAFRAEEERECLAHARRAGLRGKARK